jgi:hypothetical protein
VRVVQGRGGKLWERSDAFSRAPPPPPTPLAPPQKTTNQFYESGCDNCQFLDFAEDRDKMEVCTTPNFSG